MGAKRPDLASLREEIRKRLDALRTEVPEGTCFICEEKLPPSPKRIGGGFRRRWMHDECRTDYQSIYNVIKREAKRALGIPWSVIDPNRNKRVVAWHKRKREKLKEMNL